MHSLFSPMTINGLTLSNRIVMAPMTRYLAPEGVPVAQKANYYRKRAEGGTGLIISEGTWVPHPAASYRGDIPRFYGDDALTGWAAVVDAVHAVGGHMFPQLWHAGMSRRDKAGSLHPEVDPVGPSGLAFVDGQAEPIQTCLPMSQQDIDAVVEAFGEAAQSAKQAGFDGIEIHGAHGYLIDQFLWHVTNRRDDGYGGRKIRDRARFGAEVVAECRRRVGPAFPISFRFSQWKTIDYAARLVDSPGELEQMLIPLVEAGVDLFHCSTRRHWDTAFEGSELTLAGWTRKLSGKPTIAVGSVGLGKPFDIPTLAQSGLITNTSIERILEMLDHEECDLVGVGRALIANPDWANKVRAGDVAGLANYSLDLLDTLR